MKLPCGPLAVQSAGVIRPLVSPPSAQTQGMPRWTSPQRDQQQPRGEAILVASGGDQQHP